MNKIRMDIFDAEDKIHGVVTDSVADSIIAALSAEPETIEELEAALNRFIKPQEDHQTLVELVTKGDRKSGGEAAIVIDLAARIIATHSTDKGQKHRDIVNYRDCNGATDVWLPFNIPGDWLLIPSVEAQEGLRNRRIAERNARRSFQIRPVLYGLPLIEFVVNECLMASSKNAGVVNRGSESKGSECIENLETKRLDCQPDRATTDQSEPIDESELDGDSEIIRSIHARWLMTKRSDLNDLTPRDVIVEKLSFIEEDLSSRQLQWSALLEGPPALSRDSHAYRFAGFGFHEYVLYYDLVRHLLKRCWQRIRLNGAGEGDHQSEAGAARNGDSIQASDSDVQQTNVEESLRTWLEAVKTSWLNEPNEDLEGRVAGEIIETERRRIPLTVTIDDLMLDDDCEWCRMIGAEADEQVSPWFYHLDGSNMDSDFEFSRHRTREEWEIEERELRELDEKISRSISDENSDLDFEESASMEGEFQDSSDAT